VPGRGLRGLLWVMLVAAALRLLHLASAARSPMTFNPGPDEDFYLQFGAQVAANGLTTPLDFAFMDPLYGYFAGGVFGVVGANVLALYGVQVVVDLITLVVLHRCGLELGRPRAGLVAAGAYALCATAIMFTATALKATWVAAFVAIWLLLSLRVLAGPRASRWLVLGLCCGLAVGLRSNLLLIALGSIILLPALLPARSGTAARARGALCLSLGVMLGLAPWMARNASLGLGWTPVPLNGGIVLHHLYNARNPTAETALPEFVDYRHPIAIWRGYRREAERILGRELTPKEVDRFWRSEARAYVAAHPIQTASNALRKLGLFVAWPEIPNNRSFEEERQFSTVLARLPAPFGWLLAFGVPGLVLLVLSDRRGWAAWLPLGTCVATIMVFFAEDRFRFHAVPILALGSGLAADQCWRWARARETRAIFGLALSCAAIGLSSAALARIVPNARIEASRQAWGYLRMGETARAERIVDEGLARGDPDAALHDLRGFLAARRGDHRLAVEAYTRSIGLRPNATETRVQLARSLWAERRHAEAIAMLEGAIERHPQPETRSLLAQWSAETTSGDGPRRALQDRTPADRCQDASTCNEPAPEN
jgi:Tfp pilus assembly protein PilF